ncbi:hypothetical protein [Chitinophaga sp. Cy-1792]|uniref:hypothetical protein n=1 Tax=Chitinophaga sp. Cy-1792 TaxID=2608339 RepID=UPI0014247904|nr:hypothetical protein [Chitinophaga sp. Cy-1792]NIG55928.1 hypothetical protein [Chitinophaga sp. Cy-1792]
MNLTERLAEHVQGIFSGGNWTAVSIQQTLSDLSFEEATRQLPQFNSIALLTFHIGYYIKELRMMIDGAPLEAQDKLSWEMQPMHAAWQWDMLRNDTVHQGELLAKYVKEMPETRLWEYLGEKQYGDFYHNIHGIIEHTHYHLGQIVIIKKMIRQKVSK